MYLPKNHLKLLSVKLMREIYDACVSSHFKDIPIHFTFNEVIHRVMDLFNGVIDDETYLDCLNRLVDVDHLDTMEVFGLNYLKEIELVIQEVLPEFQFYPIEHVYFIMEGNMVFILDRRRKVYVPDTLHSIVAARHDENIFNDVGW